MENLNFVHHVVIKKYAKRTDKGVTHPHTTLNITTAKGLISALIDYTFEKVVYNNGKSDIRYMVYKHRTLPNEYAILKF